MTGLYIHIPFCSSRCVYCGFYSTTLGAEYRDAYVGALCREMRLRASSLGGKPSLSTIYLGGGTPSQLSEENIAQLFSCINETFDVESVSEITMECNPDDVTPDFAAHIARYVNRVSMGAQTFSDERLRFLRRRHTSDEVAAAVSNLLGAGIGNISIDLMFGFPGETLKEWESDIDKALQLGVEHISAYSLMYEEGTPLYAMLEQGRIHEISDDESLKMYDLLIDKLTAAGYEHYEISNFSRPDRRSRHNSSYWHGVPYIGIGAAAHSYLLENGERRRSWNVSSVKEYMAAISENHLPSESELIDDDTHYNDVIVTALRTREGISIDELSASQRDYLLSNARRFIDGGLLTLSQNHLSFTRQGLYISDSVMAELMMV
ncbi:MAG: radical SAM family heme chaperone HemW [Prevotella sp.]|nr:radical SAM family heme chaperone HemW [Prevotella sp.]